MPEIYCSVDVEANGPIPGEYSLLSIGAAAFNEDGEMIDTFSVNLETLPGAKEHPRTMEWWSKQPQAWETCRQNLIDPKHGFSAWLKRLPGTPVFVGYPTGFDFTFVYWYLIKFTGYSPFRFVALDIKSYACAVLKTPFRQTVKRTMPKEWFPKNKHKHIALDDAIEQGQLFMNMRKANMMIN